MALPIVSIIIPCYNSAKYVGGAIRSALDQTYPNCEIIAIDDGSTDESLDIIRSFGAKIRWETGSNQGGNHARNRGMELAQGDYFQFLDSDDLLPPHKIERQLSALIDKSLAIANCRKIDFTDSTDLSRWADLPVIPDLRYSGPGFLTEARLGKLGPMINPDGIPAIGHSFTVSWLIPRALAERAGPWDETMVMLQDSDFFGRALLQCREVVFVGNTWSYYRTSTANSVSKGTSRRHAESHLRHCIRSLNLLKISDTADDRLAVFREASGYCYRFWGLYPDLDRAWLDHFTALGLPLHQIWEGRAAQWMTRLLGLPVATRLLRWKHR